MSAVVDWLSSKVGEYFGATGARVKSRTAKFGKDTNMCELGQRDVI